jgi:predicted site-specific integrase-resolvase
MNLNNSDRFVKRKEFCSKLGIHYQTLYNLVKKNKVEKVILNKYAVYNLDKYIRDNNISIETNNDENKENICYCRVSSPKQKEDLERQIKMMEEKFPNHRIIKDIGSGLNFKRKGLNEIIKLGINNKINELVIAYKDRLARFGYEMIENILNEYSNAKIKILNKSEEKTAEIELSEDILAIMNVFVAKINGLRKYKKRVKEIIKSECKNCNKKKII